MAKKYRDRRFSVTLPLSKEVWLLLWAHTRGVSKAARVEAIVIEAVLSQVEEIRQEMRQEAVVRNTAITDLIKEVLRENGFEGVIDLEDVDWTAFFEGDEAVIRDEDTE